VANVADAAPVSGKVEPPARPSIRGMLAQTEIDLRLFGMLIALAVILLVFHYLSGGKLIQPANMTTLAVQAAAIAIIATGMVLVIVSRNIDLSVGSLVGVIAMTYALLMTDWLPALGLGSDVPFNWAIALGFGILMGAVIGGVQGFIIAYIGVPSFIVTLGGLLSIRGAVWYLSSGASVSGLDPTFQLLGGGAQGSIGGLLTWALALIGSVAIVALLINSRRQRRRYGFPVRPMWAEVLIGVVGLNFFVTTLGTMILGLLAGGILRSDRAPGARVRWLALAGLGGVASGWLLGALSLCPVVKRIWTPSFTLWSGGVCLLLLAGAYAVIDVFGRRPRRFERDQHDSVPVVDLRRRQRHQRPAIADLFAPDLLGFVQMAQGHVGRFIGEYGRRHRVLAADENTTLGAVRFRAARDMKMTGRYERKTIASRARLLHQRRVKFPGAMHHRRGPFHSGERSKRWQARRGRMRDREDVCRAFAVRRR